MLYQNQNVGEDFDWKNDELTVYSASKDKLESYRHYKLSISKNLFSNFSITGSFIYRDTREHWSDTKQVNYVTETTTQLSGKTLEYAQTFYQYSLGVEYSKKFLKTFRVRVNPSFVYGYVDTKDTHVSRDFYVIQNCHAFGYSFQGSVEKELTKHSVIGLSIDYMNIEDKKTDMYYYTAFSHELFATYPSSYQYKDFNFGINYRYKF